MTYEKKAEYLQIQKLFVVAEHVGWYFCDMCIV